MTRIYNEPSNFVHEMTEGFLAAYGRYVERVPGASGVMRRGGAREGKVSLIVGGGSGHYPAFCGVVGVGMADGAVMGDIFTSPSTQQAYLVAKALDGGAGILYSYGNYAGDVLNFDAAQEKLRSEGIDCRTVLCTDDIASADADEKEKRRGIAGDFSVFKTAGTAADRGEDLDTVERIANKTNAVTRSFGVAFAGCTFPGKSEPLFSVDEGKMEVGLGIHGEPGVDTVDWMSAKDLASLLVEPLLRERPEDADGRAAVYLNGLGATKYEELFLLYGHVLPLLEEAGVQIIMPEVGELVTSLDMAGCSLTLTWLDDELEDLWKAPADTPAFRRGEVTDMPEFTAKGAAGGAAEEATADAADATEESKEAAETGRRALQAMLEKVTEEEDELGRLDAVAGDGDHGVGMTRGLRAATAAADEAEGGLGSVLIQAGRAFGDKAGGTSGMLWGSILEEFGNAVGNTERPDAAGLADAVDRCVDTVKRLGKADVGDKTMLDAMAPFASTFRERVEAGDETTTAWSTAVDAADEGAQGTTDMTAKVGRARPLGERSRGTADPGAVSMVMCLRVVGEVLADNG